MKSPNRDIQGLPSYFFYDVDLSYVFTCKRETGLNNLNADISITAPLSEIDQTNIKIVPTIALEERRIRAVVRDVPLNLKVSVNPGLGSSYYSPCYFELKEVLYLPDLTSVAYFADEILSRKTLANQMDKALNESFVKPQGWERVEQLETDIEGFSSSKKRECERGFRSLRRLLALDSSQMTSEQTLEVETLTGLSFESAVSLKTDIEKSSDICTGKLPIDISGQLGATLLDAVSYLDTLEKSKLIGSLKSCEDRPSQFCSDSIVAFRKSILDPFAQTLSKDTEALRKFLELEIDRLETSQSATATYLKGLMNEIN
ncbi:MAG: hypothetical protein EOP04_09880 [Proteobacteria bacterium]|nr:MAG: hypothetical protein EOP04_09880 [Pseudomonadota bacterium]